jgi:hypothetical protein
MKSGDNKRKARGPKCECKFFGVKILQQYKSSPEADKRKDEIPNRKEFHIIQLLSEFEIDVALEERDDTAEASQEDSGEVKVSVHNTINKDRENKIKPR